MRRALSAVALAAFVGAAAQAVLAALPISRMDLPWWRARFEAKQAELRAAPPQLVFYGDSITEDWERDGPQPWARFRPIWDRFYGGLHAINLGFKGDTTANLLWRVENGEAEGIAPRVAVVLIGANNFGHVHWDAQKTLLGIDADLAAIHRHLPQTRILLLSILPSIRSPWISEQTAIVNKALAGRYPPSSNVTYLDVTGVFEKNGVVDRTLFLDDRLTPPDPPLHPTAQGQEMLAQAMQPTLERLMRP